MDSKTYVCLTTWKRFCDDLFVAWIQGFAYLCLFLDFFNNIDETGKIKFTIQVGEYEGLDFLNLKLKTTNGKISAEVFSKPTNSFTYVLPFIYYRKTKIKNVSKRIDLRLQRISNTDEKYQKRSVEYQKYLIARDYQLVCVKKQFDDVRNLSRSEAFCSIYNPSLPNIGVFVKQYLPLLLHIDENLKELFSCSCF